MFSNDYFVDGADKPTNQSNIHKSTKFKYKQHILNTPKTSKSRFESTDVVKSSTEAHERHEHHGKQNKCQCRHHQEKRGETRPQSSSFLEAKRVFKSGNYGLIKFLRQKTFEYL